MIQIDDYIISDDIRTEHFVCNLNACKGACCVEGDLGAPLDREELADLERVWPAVKPYLREVAVQEIAAQGLWVEDPEDGSLTTPLVDGRECVYVVFEGGITYCAIEKAWRDGKVDWPKPISCHLYPIRTHKFHGIGVEALNYDVWDICTPACTLGKELKMPLYKFLKAPLERKYGEAFYAKLVAAIAESDAEAGEQAPA